MSNIINFAGKSAEYERDQEVWRLLLASFSPRAIADRLKITVDEVHRSQARMSGGVTPDFRSRQMQLMLEQVKELQQGFYIKARQGDYDAATFVLRSHDMVARLLGLYAPPMRDEPLDDVKTRRSSTTDEVGDLIDEIRGVKTRTIEGEVVPKKDDGDGGSLPQ